MVSEYGLSVNSVSDNSISDLVIIASRLGADYKVDKTHYVYLNGDTT